MAPPDSENERVRCCCQKTCLKLRSVVLHVTCTRGSSCIPSTFELATTKLIARAWIVLRGRICACVLAIDLGFVTMPRVLHVCA